MKKIFFALMVLVVLSSFAQPIIRNKVTTNNITGTPSGSKFLRDDASWQTPPGASGAGPFNQNQFGQNAGVTNIKAGVLLTNVSTRASVTNEPSLMVSNIAVFDHGAISIGTNYRGGEGPHIVINPTPVRGNAQQFSDSRAASIQFYSTNGDIGAGGISMLYGHSGSYNGHELHMASEGTVHIEPNQNGGNALGVTIIGSTDPDATQLTLQRAHGETISSMLNFESGANGIYTAQIYSQTNPAGYSTLKIYNPGRDYDIGQPWTGGIEQVNIATNFVAFRNRTIASNDVWIGDTVSFFGGTEAPISGGNAVIEFFMGFVDDFNVGLVRYGKDSSAKDCRVVFQSGGGAEYAAFGGSRLGGYSKNFVNLGGLRVGDPTGVDTAPDGTSSTKNFDVIGQSGFDGLATFTNGAASRTTVSSTNGFINGAEGTLKWTVGTGSPDGAVSASIGSLYSRRDGGGGTTLYIKESGSGNTGWMPAASTVPDYVLTNFWKSGVSDPGAIPVTISNTMQLWHLSSVGLELGSPARLAHQGIIRNMAGTDAGNSITIQPGISIWGTNVFSGNAVKPLMVIGGTNGIEPRMNLIFQTTNVTVNHTCTATEYIIWTDATAGTRTNFLPANPTKGATYKVVKMDSSGNSVVIHGNGKNINGVDSLVTTTRYAGWVVTYNGDYAEWTLMQNIP